MRMKDAKESNERRHRMNKATWKTQTKIAGFIGQVF
jgi:hypothetical protein